MATECGDLRGHLRADPAATAGGQTLAPKSESLVANAGLTQTNGLRGSAFDPGSTPMIGDLGGALV